MTQKTVTEKVTDDQSRHLIRTELDVNIMVEAAAGTGKTTSIVDRMVNLIATGKCQIENLAAVTFTRKAASELRERFQSRLRGESQQSKRSAEEVKRLQVAVDRIEHSFVGTFHSFCSSLLRERPIEAGVDPAFREIEEAEDGQLRTQAWHAFLADLYSRQDNRLDRIYELGLRTNDLRQCFEQFAEFPDVQQWPHQVPPNIDVDQLKSQVASYINDMRDLVALFPVDRGNDKLMTRYETIIQKSLHTNWEFLGEFFELLESFDTSGGATLKCWHDKSVAKREKERFAEFRETTAGPALDWWYRYRYAFVIELLSQAGQIYEQHRYASGGLNYQDLLIRTAAALKIQPKLRAYFQRRFTHILVDEFQDTDPVQAEILAYLTSTDHSQTDWRQCEPRPGSLFLVGDPKQSIYRFRRADIVTYKQVKSLFENSGGRILPLTRNWRSVEPVRSFCNEVFATLFGSDETAYSPAAEDMEQGRENASEGMLAGVTTLPIPEELRRNEAIAYEAEGIARYIKHAIDSGTTIPRTAEQIEYGKSESAEPGDFLIVTHKKRDLQEFATALDNYGVPNQITGSNVFGYIPELQILVDCLRAIDDPTNPIHYVALLRGDLFGFSDAALYELKRCGGTFSYTTPLPDDMETEIHLKFENVNRRLMKYLGWLRALPYTSAVSKIASDLGLLAATSVHLDGNIVTGGFLKALEWLRAHSWDFDSATDMITFLDDLVVRSEAEGCAAMSREGSAVRIMNLHKAKGLEAPVVLLASTYGKSNHKPRFHVDRSESESKGYMWITKKHGDYHYRPVASPSDWQRFEDEEQRFLDAEDLRLLYVACTRAGSQLVISTAGERVSRFSSWQPLYSYLGDAESLAIPDEIEETLPAEQEKTEWPSLDQSNQNIELHWEAATRPSYVIVAAKEVAMQGSKRPVWHASGEYGAKWGTAIHKLLEIKSKSPGTDLKPLALQLAIEFELGSAKVEEMVLTAESVTASDIWKRSLASEKVYSEIPFESADDSGDIPTITRGVIDLVFNEPNGWVIVDYKTDDIEECDLQSAMEFYRPQLMAYANFWQVITGRSISETGLFFTKLSHYSIAPNK